MAGRCLRVLIAVLGLSGWASAGVIVVANQLPQKAVFSVVRGEGRTTRHEVESGDLLPLPASEAFTIVFPVTGQSQSRRYSVAPNSIHYFLSRDEKPGLYKLPLDNPSLEPPSTSQPIPTDRPLVKIPVKLLVDDDEPAVQAVWEKRLRRRMLAASAVFEQYCRVRFEVLAVATWESDNRIHSFTQSMAEFEQEVGPAPTRLAIGFTGQYKLVESERHLGGIRGPFRGHILIGEWPQYITESERLEVLIHELGHFLGAAHTPDAKSVMRPTLGDRKSHARSFRIGFDAPNALAMYVLAEDMGDRQITRLSELSPSARGQLRAIYQMLAKALPNDPAAAQYLSLLGRPEAVGTNPPGPRP